MSYIRENSMRRDRIAALQLVCSRPVLWLLSTFINDELLRSTSSGPCSTLLPITTRLFELGLQFLPFGFPHGKLEAVVGINRVRDLR